ncbi:penicillin-binding protein 2 [Mycoavidus sp. B2-EB]|uniref:peptidoglycan D,D-transpeptidase FtsI family protein n=1 Tax=Mycoavidus sp. B2-EB TaxID=2651972 RepID=UPI0016291ABF|nr:penicillin-binding protein 2 [Mycoavidus sp. B2-EB]BBO60289.1 peptidoglycan synthetase FtsI [Mycoavidus sp. B2-EB]
MRQVSPKAMPFSASPVLLLRLPVWRSKFVVFLLFLGFAVLAVRAWWIQGLGNDFYQKQGESRYQRTLALPATRGKIFDRNGVVLATSLPVRAIWAIPEDVPAELAAPKLEALSKLLGLSQPALRRKLAEDRSFVYLKRQVPLDVAAQVAALDVPGIYQRKEYQRFYPEGEITAHLVGFTNIEDEGQEGIELSMQKQLIGMPGSRRVIKDRMGRVVEDVDELVSPRDGRDLTLSIDSKLQYIAYNDLKEAVQRHKAKAGAAVVLDARTGEVLALVNYPAYNPNRRTQLTGAQLRNRVLTDTFEPGSIMKPLTLARALDLKRVTPTTLIDTAPGRYKLDHATISDSRDFGQLTVAKVLQKSSNIGTTKIALQLKPEEMWEMFTSVGFGQAPEISFPGAVAGRLRPWQHWRRIEQATMAYGYGISVSLFQIARAYTVLAHDGQLLPLTLFKNSEVGAGGHEPIAGVQVIAPQTARQVRQMLEAVIGPGGTAPDALLADYRAGGKSGTAYKHIKGQYDKSKYRASFVGIAPISAPRIIVAISIDEPRAGKHFGGQVAGPVFAEIANDTLRALNVTPDKPIPLMVAAQHTQPQRLGVNP